MAKKRKSATVQDIAKHLHIATSTVSRALNDHPKISANTKQKVREAAIHLGYKQHGALYIPEELYGKIIGIILPNLKETKYAIIAETARKEIENQGYQTIICCSSDNKTKEQELVKMMELVGVDGIMASLSSESKHPRHFQDFASQKPLVLFDRISFEIPCSKVTIDHFQAGFKAVQHLLSMGCKRIAHIGGNHNSSLSKQISVGYKTASRNSNATFGGKFEIFSDQLTNDVNQAVDFIFNQQQKPDSILVDDILAAQKLVSVLQTRKINIPEDVAVVAIGDENDYSYYSPSITTVQLPYQKMGKESAKLLIHQITNSNQDQETVIIPFNLNIRNSTLKGSIANQ